MKRFQIKSVSVAALIALAVAPLSSCSSNDATNTLIETTSISTAGGGAAGTGLGWLTGKLLGGKRGAQVGAIAGGVLGASLGAFLGHKWGESVVRKKSEYASQEQYIKANIKQLNTRISDARNANESLVSQINSLRKDNQLLAANEYKKCKEKVNQGKTLIDKDLKTAKSAMKDASGKELADLKAKYAALQQERAAMVSNINTLNKLSARA